MTLAEKMAAVESMTAGLNAAVAALGTSTGPADEVLAEGEAISHPAQRVVYALTGGRVLTLVLRGTAS